MKQGSTDILSGTGKSEDIVGISPGSSTEVTFTIENIGTAELILKNPPVTISGDDASEFPQASVTQPEDSVIAAGRNTTFKVVFAPNSIGIKNATISIENDDFDESSYTFSITGKTNPIANFQTRIRSGLAGLIVEFQDQSQGEITAWEWDFNGDGITDNTEQNPTYRYNEAGQYSVQLKITGPGGNDNKFKPYYVTIMTSVENIIDSDSGNFSYANDIFATDIDGDSDMDIIASNGLTTNDITWWENNGFGSFPIGDGAKHTIAGSFQGGGSVTTNIFPADIDGDGDIDILAASYRISWWENVDMVDGPDPGTDPDPGTGNGTSWTENTFVADFRWAKFVYAADIDKDGDNDVICARNGETNWWENVNGDGSAWSEYTITGNNCNCFKFACSISVADLDADGDMDIVGTLGSSKELSWCENTEDINPVIWKDNWGFNIIDDEFDSDESSVVTADFNGDNNIDILAMSIDDNEMAWWENNGTGSFTKNTVDSDCGNNNTSASSLYASDLDKDGDIDIIGTSFSTMYGGGTAWWENINGTGNFSDKIIIDYYSTGSVFAADIDGDSSVDIIGSGNYSEKITWWNMKPEWLKVSLSDDFNSASSVYSIDIDGDSYKDILASAWADDRVEWWKNDGNGSFNKQPTVGLYFSRPCTVYAADIDSDGDMDLFGAGEWYGISWWENIDGYGIIWIEHIFSDLTSPCSVHIGDLNGDGRLDIIGSAHGPGDIGWWKNDGTLPDDGTPWDYEENKPEGGPLHIKTAFIDNDDYLDIVFSHNTGGIELWKNVDGSGTLASGSFHDITSDYTFIDIIDIDEDGDVDVLAADSNNGKTAWWENDGTLPDDGTPWNEHVIDADFTSATAVFAADIDYDGDLDIVGAGDKNIVWWKNTNGEATSWKRYTITNDFDGASSVFAVDTDDDGDLDVIATASTDNEIAIFENNLIDWGQ